MNTHDYVPDCECRDCLRVTLRDTVAAAERLALERAEFRRESERLRAELAALRAQEPVEYAVFDEHGQLIAHVPRSEGQWFNTDFKYAPRYAAPAPAALPDARLGNRLYVWDYENPEDGSWDNIEEYLHDTTPGVGDVVRLQLAAPLQDVEVEMLEVGKCGEPVRWEVRDVKTGSLLAAAQSATQEGKS